jgi:hypothetical protein
MFAQTGRVCRKPVVRMYFLLRRAFKPSSPINRAALFRLTRLPYSVRNASPARSLPYR